MDTHLHEFVRIYAQDHSCTNLCTPLVHLQACMSLSADELTGLPPAGDPKATFRALGSKFKFDEKLIETLAKLFQSLEEFAAGCSNEDRIGKVGFGSPAGGRPVSSSALKDMQACECNNGVHRFVQERFWA